MGPLSIRSRTSAADVSIEFLARGLLLGLCFAALQSAGYGQSDAVVCNDGTGQFTLKSPAGLTVSVGAQRDSAFASRACQATFIWKGKETQVLRDAHQVDIDLMEADLGLGMPVVAFQMKKSSLDASMTYTIYSFSEQPRLLRTIMGGDFYRAADMDLDGRVEIWTHDAGAASGIEGLPLGDFDFPPAVVLRFEKQKLIDVSAEFQDDFDQHIAEVRAQLDPKLVDIFKRSDGKLERLLPEELSNLHGVMMTKIGVLEIVWAYLYSEREEQAWRTLSEMWPAADIDRIRASIVDRRAKGIRSEVDGVAQPDSMRKKKNRVQVIDLTSEIKTVDMATVLNKRVPDLESKEPEGSAHQNLAWPVPILLDIPAPPETQAAFPQDGVLLDLVIDGAGKVNAAKLANKENTGQLGARVLAACSGWKFIPAMSFGKAVASHILLTVSPYR